MGMPMSKNNIANNNTGQFGPQNNHRDIVDSPSSELPSPTPWKNIPDVRGSMRGPSPPMPDTKELENRFAKILLSMDLPPDKAKQLRNYPNDKKWDLLCNQEMVHAKDPPSHYLGKLRTYLDPKASKSQRKRRIVGESTSTKVLQDLEISLRTNPIEWVLEFLDDENHGLDALIDYLSFRLSMMAQERLQAENSETEEQGNQNNGLKIDHSINDSSRTNDGFNTMKRTASPNRRVAFIRPGLNDLLDNPASLRRRSRHISRLNMGATDMDIHVCIMCLRAIMNNKYGFNMVLTHREAINCLALSLTHKSLRTKALVLELLAAICLVKGGHELILWSFDNFKKEFSEVRRFQTLMNYFMNFEIFNIDFLVAAMQFVNVIVHSVEEMNYRVHLQYEFTALGLDQYLEKLRLTESEELQVQISAYLDNVFDVAALMEDSMTKNAALEQVQELQEDLGRALDKVNDMEREALYKITELETELIRVRCERDELLEQQQQKDEELRRVVKQHEQEWQSRKSFLLEWEKLTETLPAGTSLADVSTLLANGKLSDLSPKTNGVPLATAAQSQACPAPPPPPPPVSTSQPPPPPPPNQPPKAPPKPSCNGAPAPPPPAFGSTFVPDGAMTIKRKHQTKYKMPTLNWIALKPNQVRGTIFNELDDEKLFSSIDFVDFENQFKIGNALTNGHSDVVSKSIRAKKPENLSLLEHTRLRNIAISRRKLGLPVDMVIKAINNLDLKQLTLENVELLQKMIPLEQEIKAYKDFVIEKRDVNLLTDEDKFMLQLTKVERIASKLSIMNYMGNFEESFALISPQIYAILVASSSVKSSKKFRAVLEVVLAFGNYLNSSKRGPAYGFKLQSLDALLDTKSTDKKTSLMHYIVATIRQKFPELLNFDVELNQIAKAAQVSLENVVQDVQELEKGMEVVSKEANQCGKGPQNHVLRDFLQSKEEKLKKIKVDCKNAQDVFKECIEYFGESSRNADANAFFSLLVRFVRAFKTTDQENEQRRRLEAAAKNNRADQKRQQAEVISELKSRTKLLPQNEVYDGALEDILKNLKNEPFRSDDAVRRSSRRRYESNRFSRTLEESDIC